VTSAAATLDPASEWVPVDHVRWDMAVTFPGKMSEAEIMQAFESSFLLPRPTFSFATAVRVHAWAISAGFGLFASGLLVLAWMFHLGAIQLRK